MWNRDGGEAPEVADGNAEEDETVHDWEVPDAGASVPPEVTTVDGWLANSSTATGASL